MRQISFLPPVVVSLLIVSLEISFSCSSVVVNCVQCHPFDNVVATSGIDDTIKVNVIRCTLFVEQTRIISEFYRCIVLDMDSKCSCPVNCSRWSRKSRN